MNKSILIIDKPVNCDECDICCLRVTENGEQMEFCPMTGWMEIKTAQEGIQSNCPLKAMPVKEPCNYYNFETYVNGYGKGWNDCIDYLNDKGRWEKKQEKKDVET